MLRRLLDFEVVGRKEPERFKMTSERQMEQQIGLKKDRCHQKKKWRNTVNELKVESDYLR